MNTVPEVRPPLTRLPIIRAVAFAAIVLTVAAALAVVQPTPSAVAATTGAGISSLTPDHGYLGNYVAPDGSRVYCIDSSRAWPDGATSSPQLVDVLTSTWGTQFTPEVMHKLNYGLLTYGQTADPVQAAAVAAFVNAYTSGWARDLGAGYDAGAYYINGNSAVTASYAAMWADVEANAVSRPSATLSINMTDLRAGTVTIATDPMGASGKLTLDGAVVDGTAQTTAEVTDGSVISITGLPADDRGEYSVTAHASFVMPTPAAPSVVLYTTGDQQRTIRGGNPGEIDVIASASTDIIPLHFAPEVVTTVETATVQIGEPLIDRVTAVVAEGSLPWRQRLDGSFVSMRAHGVLYGPFSEAPTLSDLVPDGAAIAGETNLLLVGPGEHSTEPTLLASAPGYYTWVWSIDSAAQEPADAATLPTGYLYTSEFGIEQESHLVEAPPQPPAQLAVTGRPVAAAGTAVLAGLLLCLGVVAGIFSRRRRSHPRH